MVIIVILLGSGSLIHWTLLWSWMATLFCLCCIVDRYSFPENKIPNQINLLSDYQYIDIELNSRRMKFFFQQDDTKIVNFDSTWSFFWGNVVFMICPSISKVTIYVPNFLHCLASPGKVSALACKAKPAWIERSIHYVIFQHYNPGSYSKKFLHTTNVTFDTEGANFENDIASEKWLWNQNAFIKIISKSLILL